MQYLIFLLVFTCEKVFPHQMFYSSLLIYLQVVTFRRINTLPTCMSMHNVREWELLQNIRCQFIPSLIGISFFSQVPTSLWIYITMMSVRNQQPHIVAASYSWIKGGHGRKQPPFLSLQESSEEVCLGFFYM